VLAKFRLVVRADRPAVKPVHNGSTSRASPAAFQAGMDAGRFTA
jgi:hypothetical protein